MEEISGTVREGLCSGENFGSSGINVGQTEEAEDLYLYADASHTQIFRPNRRGYNARANDLNLPILWLDF